MNKILILLILTIGITSANTKISECNKYLIEGDALLEKLPNENYVKAQSLSISILAYYERYKICVDRLNEKSIKNYK